MPLPILMILVKKLVEFANPKVLLAVIVMLSCAYAGWYVRNAKAVEQIANIQGQTIEKIIVETREVEKIVTEYIEKEAEIVEVFIEIEKEVENVEIESCDDLGAEFVSVFNDAARSSGIVR